MDNNYNKETKGLQDRIHKAENGDVKMQFQLGKDFLLGKNVTKNIEKSDCYFNKVLESSLKFHPLISSLELYSFRRFESKEITFHDGITIIAGKNGAGKTSIIEAISISLSWLSALIKNEDGNGHYLEEKDINTPSNSSYTSVVTNLSILPKLDYKLTLAKTRDGSTSKQKSKLVDFRQLAEIYRQTKSPLPILAYYSVARSLEINKDDFIYAKKNANRKSWKQLDGYTESLDESRSFRQLLTWLVRVDSVEKSTESTEIVALKSKYETKKSFLELIPDDSSENKKLRAQLETEIAETEQAILEHDKNTDQSDIGEIKLAQEVKEAIYDFMPLISNIRIIHTMDKVDMVMEKEGVTISALQLSQGEKSLLALVGDIARRMVMLNPSKQHNFLKGCGIVIIDEIDLHLHPAWQQKVVIQLNDTFPNIQFILTTHSPQVLSTVAPESIRIIQDIDNSIEIKTPEFSLGSESKFILEELLGVSSRAENIEIVKELNEYEKLISLDKWDSPRALELKDILNRWAGLNDPIMMKLDMDIRLRRRRRRRSKLENEKN